MAIDLNNGFEELKAHIGHRVVIVGYSTPETDVVNVAIECNDCGMVLLDFDRPDLAPCPRCGAAAGTYDETCPECDRRREG